MTYLTMSMINTTSSSAPIFYGDGGNFSSSVFEEYLRNRSLSAAAAGEGNYPYGGDGSTSYDSEPICEDPSQEQMQFVIQLSWWLEGVTQVTQR